jgi:hypothetical protein
MALLRILQKEVASAWQANTGYDIFSLENTVYDIWLRNKVNQLNRIKMSESINLVNIVFNHNSNKMHDKCINRCIQGNGTKDAPSDKFSEPYLKPTTPESSEHALQKRWT